MMKDVIPSAKLNLRFRHQRLTIAIFLTGLILWSGCAGAICSDEEQLVLAEFPQYGGVKVAPEGNGDTGACAVYYEVPDSPEQVQRYFIDQLAAHGSVVTAVAESGRLVQAQRGDYSYIIYYESLESYLTPRPGLHLAVHVGKK